MSITAQYADTCEACDSAIRPGQLIDRDPFTERWMHTECPQDTPRPACPECFMTKALSGSCGCDE